jgi:hypothetical protein
MPWWAAIGVMRRAVLRRLALVFEPPQTRGEIIERALLGRLGRSGRACNLAFSRHRVADPAESNIHASLSGVEPVQTVLDKLQQPARALHLAFEICNGRGQILLDGSEACDDSIKVGSSS